jgi:hypothetical protein
MTTDDDVEDTEKHHPSHPSGVRPRPSGARRRPLAAAVLNASGTGAGYLFLGSRVLAAASLAGTLLLLILANVANASDRPGVWAFVYLLWLAVSAAGAWWRALPRRPRPPRPPTAQPVWPGRPR